MKQKDSFSNTYRLSKNLVDKLFFLIIIWACLVFTTELSAQMIDMNFGHIMSDKGLSQNTIHSILQDKEGFLWFATEDGLDKYDGYEFTVYKNNPHLKNTISDNFIWTIYEDREGTLWIGTNSGGLSRYNRDTEQFVNYKNNPADSTSLSNNNVRAIFEDKDGALWIGTEGGGLNKYNEVNDTFEHYRHDPEDPYSLNNDVILCIYQDHEGTIWIGTDGGLDKFDKLTGRFESFVHKKNNSSSISSNIVFSLYEDYDGNFWVGTLDGFNLFDRNKKKFKRYYSNTDISSNLDNGRINSILEDKTGKLWVATGGGLYQFNKISKKFISLSQLGSHTTSLSNNNILSLYEDNSGIIWVGTAEGGIIKFDRERMKFRHYQHDPANPNSLSYNTVRSIYQDKSGLLWIGTLGGGLNRFDRRNNHYTHYLHRTDKTHSLSDNSVTAIFRDSYGTLWVGTWSGGLNKMTKYSDSSPEFTEFTHYIHDDSNPHSISNNIVQSIYEDSQGRFWIGTGLGLDILDRSTGNFYNFVNNPHNSNSLSDNQVQSCIIEDEEGNLWIGTWNGLNKIALSTVPQSPPYGKLKFQRFTHDPDSPSSLSDNRIISIHEDKQGNLWLGTYGGGLNELAADQKNVNPKNAKFIHYFAKDGLASNIVYGILGDELGNLWVSTDNGLSKFNPNSRTFRNYYQSDGLQGNQFYWGASFKGKNDELFFGGTNGVNAFYPSSLKDNKHIPPIVITDLQIFNQPVKIGAKKSPLKKSITETHNLQLSYSQNVFSFEFAALDFTATNKNQYKYMMEGFDKNWISAGNRRYVTYTNLDPGTYTFKVIGSNNDGVWNTKGTSINVTILPPFWKTWWFILTSLLLIGGIIVAFITSRVRNLLAIERFRIKLAADLHDNIGSSLTEISILSEVISKKLISEDPGIKKNLKMISNSSRNLIDNMSDIVWLVNPKRDSLYDLILRLRDTYSELSSYTSISFRSENLKSLEKVSLSMEHRQHLYLIFKEGINNCITHSGCSEISLDAFVKGKRLEMLLKDNGAGFDIGTVENNGNGLENIKHRAKLIGGDLFIKSKPGEGTTIQFVGNIL